MNYVIKHKEFFEELWQRLGNGTGDMPLIRLKDQKLNEIKLFLVELLFVLIPRHENES